MRDDVLAWANGVRTDKLVSKETLNHQGLIELVIGLDVYRHTADAYRRTYRALGIDIINRVPLENAPLPTPVDEIRPHLTAPYHLAPLGIFDTAMRHSYLVDEPEAVFDIDVAHLHYEDLITPSPHPCTADDIRQRDAFIGNVGLYYPMLYTTLFMWGVEWLGWHLYLLVGALEPDRFHDHFLVPCAQKSRQIVAEMARASDSPFVFVHDDLASGTGPVFKPQWYDDYILPHYPDILAPAKDAGKKIMLVADGDMTAFLPKLRDVGIDGLMFETPTTPLEAVIEHFGDGYFIGGIDTKVLSFGTADDIRIMVHNTVRQAGDYAGFALASGGGLHGNIPLENLEAYFDARVDVGATPPDWRTISN